VRIGITDFLAADASANLFMSMVAQFGDAATYDIWRQIHPKVVQYARYLSNPVRQAGMGEVDVAIAVESEAIRYMQGGYPLKIVYPADGTAAMITGTGIAYKAKTADAAAAKEFADWLLSDEAQQALQKQEFYFVPTNPGTLSYKSFAGKNMLLFDQPVNFTDQQRHDFLDRWVKEVRFK
jgi:iron(III) transport system substrate-binding protein